MVAIRPSPPRRVGGRADSSARAWPCSASRSARSPRRCDGVSRRDFLRVGGLAALGLPTLLRAEARRRRIRRRPPARSVILLYLGGGLSHHDSFDPKPDAPAEVKGQVRHDRHQAAGRPVLATSSRGWRRRNDRFSLVRSGAHGNDHHETATNWVLSGKFGSAFGDYPAIGAVVAHELGYRGPMPPYFAVPRNPSFTWELGKSAFLGGRYESFKSGDPNDTELPRSRTWPSRRDYVAEPGRPPPVAPRRRSTTWPARSTPTTACGRWTNSSAGRWTWSSRPRPAAPSTSPARTPGSATATAGPPPARRACWPAGWSRRASGSSRSTAAAGTITPTSSQSLDRRLPEFDLALSALIDDLDVAGPARLDPGRRDGRVRPDARRSTTRPAATTGATPPAWSSPAAGVAPGRVIGRTDDQGAHVIDRPVSPADVAATIYHAVGVDPSRHLMTPENRPVAILDEGSPIAELLA